MAYREDDVLPRVNVSTQDTVEGLVNSRCCSQRVAYFVRRRTVAALSDNPDFDHGAAREETALTYSDVTFVKLWYVVITIYLVHTVEATFFNHISCSTKRLLSRLIEKSYLLTLRNRLSILNQNLCNRCNGSHMSIMATHMCMVGLRSILKPTVILGHWKCIHVTSKCNSSESLWIHLSIRLTMNVNH